MESPWASPGVVGDIIADVRAAKTRALPLCYPPPVDTRHPVSPAGGSRPARAFRRYADALQRGFVVFASSRPGGRLPAVEPGVRAVRGSVSGQVGAAGAAGEL